MPRHDDDGIPPEATLIRAVLPDWITSEDGTERLNSKTFRDGLLEASCFISEEVGGIEGFRRTILPRLEEELGREILDVAIVSARDVRAHELWIYRKPEEFFGNAAHVVICPPAGVSKSQYAKRTGRLANDARRESAK